MSKETDRRPRIISLTTDFGLRDEYVGMIKGVVLSHCREASVVDLTHGIEPQNIAQAAMTIGASFRFFPKGTVHMVVVDPGVGSDRRILAVRAEDHLFVAPDNGVLTPLFNENYIQDVFHINNRDLFSETISSSFHGRDIMAPVAAGLACGMDIALVGPRLSTRQCCRIPLPKATVTDGNIIGEIIHIDHFGNLRTSITAEDFSLIAPNAGMEVSVGGHSTHVISASYTDPAAGKIIALFDSRNHLEIAVNGGNAALMLCCRRGDLIMVRISEEKG
jgi:S-adenosyl-L-methionine hydrolase (adenosine-forming)